MELIIKGEFWMFNGQEGPTKIEQVWRKEEFWTFWHNIIMSAHPLPHENEFNIEKFQRLIKCFNMFKANLIAMANKPAPHQ